MARAIAAIGLGPSCKSDMGTKWTCGTVNASASPSCSSTLLGDAVHDGYVFATADEVAPVRVAFPVVDDRRRL